MSNDRTSFADDAGEIRLAGGLIPDPAASSGDVPTATGTPGEPAVWQPAGGGSVPDPITSTLNVVVPNGDVLENLQNEAGDAQFVVDTHGEVLAFGNAAASNGLSYQADPAYSGPLLSLIGGNGEAGITKFGVGADGTTTLHNAQIKGVAEGTDPSDAATVSQLGGSQPGVGDYVVIEQDDVQSIPNNNASALALTSDAVSGLIGSSGTTITVGEEDFSTITVSLDGIYAISGVIDFHTSDPTGKRYIVLAPAGLNSNAFINSSAGDPDKNAECNVACSLTTFLSAGATIQVKAGVTDAAGNVDVDFAQVVVTRVA